VFGISNTAAWRLTASLYSVAQRGRVLWLLVYNGMFKMIALPHLRLFRRFFTWSVAFVAIVSVSFWLIYVSVEQRLRLVCEHVTQSL